MKKYILRNGDYYLADLMYDYEESELKQFVIDKEYKKVYEVLDHAIEDKNLIYIETGLELMVEEYETKNN